MQCFVDMAQDLPLVGDIWARYEGRSRLAGSDESPRHRIGPPAINILTLSSASHRSLDKFTEDAILYEKELIKHFHSFVTVIIAVTCGVNLK